MLKPKKPKKKSQKKISSDEEQEEYPKTDEDGSPMDIVQTPPPPEVKISKKKPETTSEKRRLQKRTTPQDQSKIPLFELESEPSSKDDGIWIDPNAKSTNPFDEALKEFQASLSKPLIDFDDFDDPKSRVVSNPFDDPNERVLSNPLNPFQNNPKEDGNDLEFVDILSAPMTNPVQKEYKQKMQQNNQGK